MKVSLKEGKIEKEKDDAIVLGHFEGSKKLSASAGAVDKALGGLLKELLDLGDFTGKFLQTTVLPTRGDIPARRVMLVGLGKEEEFTIDRLRQAAGRAATRAQELGLKGFSAVLLGAGRKDFEDQAAAQAITEGVLLALYSFNTYKTGDKDKKPVEHFTLVESDHRRIAGFKEGIVVGQVEADAVNFTRELIMHPGNKMTPTILGKRAQEMAREAGLKCQVLGPKELEKLGFGGLLGVARGSDEPPAFIILEYNAGKPSLDTVVFVGKGITFDSGGISLKPGENMDKMKYDMSGGAAVLGALKAVAALKLPLHVVGLVPATENLPSGKATKPGDILTSYSGKTMEVLNTDAEGRLILSDALGYAATFKPKAVVDLATLTGACVIALGNLAIGMLGNNDGLKARVQEAADLTGERVWELPLWPEYRELVKSDIADLKNIGPKGQAGTIMGAAFLAAFTDDYHWVHLDIAGTAWEDKGRPYHPKGATGVGVRLLTELARHWSSHTEAAAAKTIRQKVAARSDNGKGARKKGEVLVTEARGKAKLTK